MESNIPDQLTALAHPNRLDLFRLLMRRYPDAVAAGEIAAALGLKPNTASVYLTALRQAGLIRQDRNGKSLLYSADLPNVRALFSGLLSECCQNRPDLCLSDPNQRTGPMSDPNKIYSVLFICTGNSARSIMAEAILNALGAGRFRAFSAGTRPAARPHPEVLALLEAKDYDISALTSKSMETILPDLPPLDFVFTVCDQAANEECPVWPGQPMNAHWGLPDPVKAEGNEAQKKLAFQQAYGLLRNRISAFASLPIETLDKIALQHKLDGIGQKAGQSEMA